MRKARSRFASSGVSSSNLKFLVLFDLINCTQQLNAIQLFKSSYCYNDINKSMTELTESLTTTRQLPLSHPTSSSRSPAFNLPSVMAAPLGKMFLIQIGESPPAGLSLVVTLKPRLTGPTTQIYINYIIYNILYIILLNHLISAFQPS